jgi:ribosomal protein S18 acetylase RimI-like enzyme
MALTSDQAHQIALLLNARNQLSVVYTAERVLNSAADYLIRSSESGDVAACVEVKRVQWYQAELLHLTVAESEEGKGHGKALLASAEQLARQQGARLLQCTIREDNRPSEGLFRSAGYSQVGVFFNERSGNNVFVFQKVVSNAHDGH